MKRRTVSLIFYCSILLSINNMKVATNCREVFLLVIVGLFFSVSSCKSHSYAVEPPNDSQSAATFVTQADQHYAQRENLQFLRQGIIELRQAQTADPGSYDAAWRLAKFNYYLATHTDGDERDKAFRGGIEAGEAAIGLQSNRPEGHFWLGANYGGSLEQGSIFGLATVADVRKEMQAVLSLDEGYQSGSAHMVLGLVDLKAPRLLGGDRHKAVEEMEKGLRFGENNAFLRLHLAEAYQAVGRSNDARQQLNAIISMTPDPTYLPEYKEATATARRLLETMGGSNKDPAEHDRQ
jgi:Tfp pilus assembly protein PilF